MHKSVPATRQRGMTLVELLVAITVLGVVAVLGWRGLDSIVRSRIALNSDLEQTRGMQLTFAQMQSDCAHLAAAFVLPDRQPISIKPRQLTLIRTVFGYDQPSRLQVISYRLVDGELTRHESVPTRDLHQLDADWQAAVGTAEPSGQAVVLQTGVASLTMRLWYNGANNWRAQSDAVIPVAGATASPQLQPTGLEVTFQQQGHDGSMLKIFLLGAV